MPEADTTDQEPFWRRRRTQAALMLILAALVLSFILYRPFCSLVCPFGFVSWIVERFSLVHVRIDHDLCTKCGACVHACPSHAAGGRVEGKRSSPDCFSCARCLNVCPEDAIRYRSVFRKALTGRAAGMPNQEARARDH